MKQKAKYANLPAMSSTESIRKISKIPVTVVQPKVSYKLHWQRRALQLATVLIAVLIPATGLFRIDLVVGAFVILDRQIWWSDFFLVFGFWMLSASGLVVMYSTLGTSFCGWSCPQNSLSEWANYLTRKLLGKRAEVGLHGEKMKVASKKNKWGYWLVLGVILMATSMAFALIPLFYFYPLDVIWSFISFQDDERLAASLHYIYLIFVLVIFVDITFIRHFFCRFMCVYKIWQHGFKTKQTLHLAYDDSRSSECEKCNYCVTACFIELDPRRTDIYDTCINCGECVTACNNLHAKKGETGLLRFEVGRQDVRKRSFFRVNLGSLSTRMKWTAPFAFFALVMFLSGIYNYERYHLAVYRADTTLSHGIQNYRVSVSNKLYHSANLSITIKGLPAGSYSLSKSEVVFDTVGRIDIELHIGDGLSSGLHAIVVSVESMDGWHDSFRVQHFVERS